MSKPIQEIACNTYHEIIAYELRAAIRHYFDFLEELHWKEEMGSELYLLSIEQRRMPIFIFSCTLLECVINFYLCTKFTAEQFEKVDRNSLFNKWAKVPRKSIPTYSLPTSQ